MRIVQILIIVYPKFPENFLFFQEFPLKFYRYQYSWYSPPPRRIPCCPRLQATMYVLMGHGFRELWFNYSSKKCDARTLRYWYPFKYTALARPVRPLLACSPAVAIDALWLASLISTVIGGWCKAVLVVTRFRNFIFISSVASHSIVVGSPSSSRSLRYSLPRPRLRY